MYFHIKGIQIPRIRWGKGHPREMDPLEHIHGHLLGGSISHATGIYMHTTIAKHVSKVHSGQN